MPDSSLVSVRLADNRRLVVASPRYLARRGTPQHPNDLGQHDCLVLSSDASQTRGWAFSVADDDRQRTLYVRPRGPLTCTDGQVLYAWCLAGHGLAWRSTWEVQDDLQAGRLTQVLDAYAAPPNGVYAVFPSARHLPLRVRAWLDFVKARFASEVFP
jgi:DNA-binding transcriptional LysR family regulator